MHRRYFEDLIATAIAADAEANAPLEEVLTEEEREEVASLRQAVDALSEKYEGILGSLRVDEVRACSNKSVCCQRCQMQPVCSARRWTLRRWA